MDWQISTAARTLWQEARGEPLQGQQAVAAVLWNRVRSGLWGPSLGSVCLSRNQFSAWGPVVPSSATMRADFHSSCALPDDSQELLHFASLLVQAEKGPDPTKGALYYYAPVGVSKPPLWVAGMLPCGKFGNQLFFRPKPAKAVITPENEAKA